MPEHFHILCYSENLTDIIKSIKGYTAKEIIQYYKENNNMDILNAFQKSKKEYKTKSKYQVWQEGFFPKIIKDEMMFNQKVDYIHYNPVKRGLVERVEDYEYSSAIDYYTDRVGKIKIDGI